MVERVVRRTSSEPEFTARRWAVRSGVGMKPERMDAIKQGLRERGVPESVISYVTEDGLNWWSHFAVSFFPGFIFLCFSGLILRFPIWRLSDGLVNSIAKNSAINNNAVFYEYNFGLSLLIFMPVIIFGSALFGAYILSLSQYRLKNAFVFSILDGVRSPIWGFVSRGLMQRLRAEQDPDRYVRNFVLGWVPAMTALTLFLAAVGALAFARDIQTHSIYTPTAYIRSPFLPWASKGPYEWREAVAVEIGCNHVADGDEVKNSFVYRVRFADGTSIYLGDAKPLKGSWIDAVEIIDRELIDAGVRFAPWARMGQIPYHPRCLAYLRDQYSDEDSARIERLLRLPG